MNPRKIVKFKFIMILYFFPKVNFSSQKPIKLKSKLLNPQAFGYSSIVNRMVKNLFEKFIIKIKSVFFVSPKFIHLKCPKRIFLFKKVHAGVH